MCLAGTPAIHPLTLLHQPRHQIYSFPKAATTVQPSPAPCSAVLSNPLYHEHFQGGAQRLSLPSITSSRVLHHPLTNRKQSHIYKLSSALAGQTAEHSFVLDFFVTFFVQACPPQAGKKVRKGKKTNNIVKPSSLFAFQFHQTAFILPMANKICQLPIAIANLSTSNTKNTYTEPRRANPENHRENTETLRATPCLLRVLSVPCIPFAVKKQPHSTQNTHFQPVISHLQASIRFCLSSIRLCLSSIRLCLLSIPFCLLSIPLYLSSIRLCLSSIRLCQSSIRLCLPSIRFCLLSKELCLSSIRTCL